MFGFFRDAKAKRRALALIREAGSSAQAAPLLSDTTTRALAGIARDETEREEVRIRAVEVLVAAAPPGLLAVLRGVAEAHRGAAPALEVALTLARATLGDVAVALATLRLAYGLRYEHNRPARAALAALEGRAGREALARALGAVDASPEALAGLAASREPEEARRFALERLPAEHPSLPQALADDALVMVEGAVERLSASEAHHETLVGMAAGAGDVRVRAWATLVLHRRGRAEEARAAWASLRDAVLPDLPVSVRRAVLHQYLPAHRGTEPWHVLEAELDHGFTYENEHEAGPDEPFATIHAAARDALLEEGILLDEPEPIGNVRNQGEGTYYEAEAEGRVLSLSALGRFIAYDEPPSHRARAALERAGFLFVDGALADAAYEGLYVYDFGTPRVQTVRALLFYWVD